MDDNQRFDTMDGHVLPVISIHEEWDRKIYSDKAIRTTEDVIELVGPKIVSLANECMIVICNTTGDRPVCIGLVSLGNNVQGEIPLHRIFQIALLANADSITVLHNHPGFSSKSPYASIGDIETTNMIKRACDLFSIYLKDHIIVGKRVAADGTIVPEYYSMREKKPHGLKLHSRSVKTGFFEYVRTGTGITWNENDIDWDGTKKKSDKYWKRDLSQNPDVIMKVAFSEEELDEKIKELNQEIEKLKAQKEMLNERGEKPQ